MLASGNSSVKIQYSVHFKALSNLCFGFFLFVTSAQRCFHLSGILLNATDGNLFSRELQSEVKANKFSSTLHKNILIIHVHQRVLVFNPA